MLYSVLEQHLDGSWWYHPWVGTYKTKEEAEASFHKHFDDGRPHLLYEHMKPLFQRFSTCTHDFVNFEFGGKIMWTKEDLNND